ncbi:hypothetical protein [Streptomyces sp. NPDC048442]|uniref:hypothetical protein n=1 Tax=Streptomyces sp. NPDC048442 TaxID=3154823 RepID=UPI003425A608
MSSFRGPVVGPVVGSVVGVAVAAVGRGERDDASVSPGVERCSDPAGLGDPDASASGSGREQYASASGSGREQYASASGSGREQYASACAE